MLIRIGGQFQVEDYLFKNHHLHIVTNVKPNFNILRQSKSLIVNGETRKMVKTAKLITVAPKAEDFLYIRNRAVSAGNVIDDKYSAKAQLIPMETLQQFFPKYANIVRGANDNGDFFSHEELKKCYKTFIGKAVFVDHDNENIERARGIILDAVYNENGYFVELLKAIDRKAYPELARAIEMSYVTSTSMGCRCAYSICSICGNKAHTEDEFCEHVQNYKGSTYNGLPVWEDNRDVNFFESSMVSQPADINAKVLEKIASSAHTRRNEPVIRSQLNGISNMKLRNEMNQRTYDGQIKSIFDELNDLPWG